MNEGISFPVEDKSIETFRLIAYGGHGICMAFWGVTDDRQGHGVIIETPDDAAIHLVRLEDRLAVAPEWDAQKGQFGYARRLRYVFFDGGGHVAIAKRYREYARQIGLLKTLAEKRQENPNVDLLVGAVNIWNWDADPVQLATQMQAAGIERILWSRGGSAERAPHVERHESAHQPLRHLPGHDESGQFPVSCAEFIRTGRPPAGRLTSFARPMGTGSMAGRSRAPTASCTIAVFSATAGRWTMPGRAFRRSWPPTLTCCRFIDTTTASPWNECYDPHHPMTRTESREWKMKLLDYVSHDCKLVTGSETGHDAAVPFVDYFEGMLSLGPYRVPDAGRDMQRIWDDPPERVAKFQLGQAYRLPLWELVYHDCVVAQWYWGDYNNKLPSLWDKRDLFNVLYGTPPMFMFDKKLWETQKARFVQSYTNTCPYVRAAGYSEMTDHRFLTADRNVQQTAFANGVTITVNFGTTPFRLASGETLPPGGFRADGMPK